MGKTSATEKFIRKSSLGRIRDFLVVFADYHAKKLPGFLIRNDNEKIMLDILKIRNQDIFLPVAVNSNLWLRFINGIARERDFKICLHNERWPFQQRFNLIGGFKGIAYPGSALANYLKCSLEFWDNHGKISKTSVSERVADISASKDFKFLIKETEVIQLSEEYKAEEVDVSW